MTTTMTAREMAEKFDFIELVVHFKKGHARAEGRVIFIEDAQWPAVWVGKVNIDPDVQVIIEGSTARAYLI